MNKILEMARRHAAARYGDNAAAQIGLFEQSQTTLNPASPAQMSQVTPSRVDLRDLPPAANVRRVLKAKTKQTQPREVSEPMRLPVRDKVNELCSTPEYLALKLTQAQDRVYRGLLELALTYVRVRGMREDLLKVATFHMPAELVQKFVGYGHTTFYKARNALIDKGLLASKGKITWIENKQETPEGETAPVTSPDAPQQPVKRNRRDSRLWLTRSSGSLFCVKLDPRHDNLTPRFTHEELHHEWRDLQADMEAGKTAFNFLQSMGGDTSKAEEVVNANYLIRNWSLSPLKTENLCVVDVSPPPSSPDQVIYELLDLRDGRKRERGARVEILAHGLAARYKDQKSVHLYMFILWQLLRLLDMQNDQFPFFINQLHMLDGAIRDGEVRKCPGAYLVHRLKQLNLWEDLKLAGQDRVTRKAS